MNAARDAQLRALFIINPTAGANRAGARWRALAPRLAQAGMGVEPRFTNSATEAAELARRTANDHELLVAVGGDGTVSAVANGLLEVPYRKSALGVIPFGTGNDYAHALGICNEGDAINSLLSGQMRLIDTIAVHCLAGQKPFVRHALLFAGVGIIGETLKQTTGFVKRLFGQRFAYPIGLARALCTYRSPSMKIVCGTQRHDGQVLFVGASNTEIAGGGMRIAPGAQIDDGVLNVNLVKALGRWEAFGQLRRACQGRHTEHPHVQYFTATNIEIEADEPLEVAADGDLVGTTPARFNVQPKALRVRVPSAR